MLIRARGKPRWWFRRWQRGGGEERKGDGPLFPVPAIIEGNLVELRIAKKKGEKERERFKRLHLFGRQGCFENQARCECDKKKRKKKEGGPAGKHDQSALRVGFTRQPKKGKKRRKKGFHGIPFPSFWFILGAHRDTDSRGEEGEKKGGRHVSYIFGICHGKAEVRSQNEKGGKGKGRGRGHHFCQSVSPSSNAPTKCGDRLPLAGKEEEERKATETAPKQRTGAVLTGKKELMATGNWERRKKWGEGKDTVGASNFQHLFPVDQRRFQRRQHHTTHHDGTLEGRERRGGKGVRIGLGSKKKKKKKTKKKKKKKKKKKTKPGTPPKHKPKPQHNTKRTQQTTKTKKNKNKKKKPPPPQMKTKKKNPPPPPPPPQKPPPTKKKKGESRNNILSSPPSLFLCLRGPVGVSHAIRLFGGKKRKEGGRGGLRLLDTYSFLIN